MSFSLEKLFKSSSNSNNAVNFATAPEIFSTYPSEVPDTTFCGTPQWDKLSGFLFKYNCFTAVRSAGLWIGLELNPKMENLTLQNIMSSAYDEGLMILKANNNTLRLAPALTISEKEIKLGVKKLEKSLSRLL